MSSPNSTPEVSPLRSSPVPEAIMDVDLVTTDHEEGEISDDDLSEISEGQIEDSGELEDGEIGSQEEDPNHVLHNYLDSPASPDSCSAVAGPEFPVRIIPASPERIAKSDGHINHNDPDEEEDIDEDILYLRLIALRSIASEDRVVSEREREEKQNLAIEMQELINEAEEAANYENYQNAAALPEILTIEDDEDDVTITEMKQSLQSSFVKLCSVEESDSALLQSYSPTQSIEKLSPPESPRHCAVSPFIDLVSPVPSPDDIPLPNLPPLPPPPLLPSPTGIPNPKALLSASPPPPPPPPLPSPPPYPNENALQLPPPVPAGGHQYVSQEEPPPPGEDIPPEADIFSQTSGRSKIILDVDPEVEAEKNFFNNQNSSEIIFPSSVWDFSKTSENYFQTNYDFAPAHVPPQPVITECEIPTSDIVNDKEQSKTSTSEKTGRSERKRRTSVRKETYQKKRRKSEKQTDAIKEDDDEHKLRAFLLAQVSKSSSSSSIQHGQNKENKLKPVVSKKLEPAIPVKVNKKTVKQVAEKIRPAVQNVKTRPDKLGNDQKKTISKPKSAPGPQLTKDQKEKHFPNLTKIMVIPLSADTESDEDETEESSGKTMLPQEFGLNLDSFLKQARNNTARANVPTLTVKHRPINPKLKAQAKSLTIAQKKKIFSSNINHLPLTQQIEYMKLKQMIAKKEEAKKKKLLLKTKLENVSTLAAVHGTSSSIKVVPVSTQSFTVPSVAVPSTVTSAAIVPAITVASAPVISDTVQPNLDPTVNRNKIESLDSEEKTGENVDEEEELRMNLLKDLMNNAKRKVGKIDKESGGNKVKNNKNTPGTVPPRRSSSSMVSTQSKLTVQVTGNRRNVELKRKENKKELVVLKKCLPIKEGVDCEKLKALGEAEKSVVKYRQSLSQDLYKLSAQMSQLQHKTIELDSAEKYADELRKQLKETEALVKERQDRVENLREVIRHSHKEVTNSKKRLYSEEDRCKLLGLEVHGQEYTPPAKGADNIRKKLVQIKSTALKVKTSSVGHDLATLQTKNQSDSNVNEGSGTVPYVNSNASLSGLEFSSSLEHLRSDNNTRVLDPDTVLCKFELDGACKDDSCPYQHCRPAS